MLVAFASPTPDPLIAELQATIAALRAQLARTPTPITITRTVTVVVTPAAMPTPPPTPSPAPPSLGGHVGEPAIFANRDGTRKVSITVNKIIDPATSSNRFNQPKGRWVVVDWSIANLGTQSLDINPLDFRLQTADGFVIAEGNGAGLPEPLLDLATLAPGQSMRGYIAYDVPAGARIARLFYQPYGSGQLTVVDLTQP